MIANSILPEDHPLNWYDTLQGALDELTSAAHLHEVLIRRYGKKSANRKMKDILGYDPLEVKSHLLLCNELTSLDVVLYIQDCEGVDDRKLAILRAIQFATGQEWKEVKKIYSHLCDKQRIAVRLTDHNRMRVLEKVGIVAG